jgi:hypothetical protein
MASSESLCHERREVLAISNGGIKLKVFISLLAFCAFLMPLAAAGQDEFSYKPLPASCVPWDNLPDQDSPYLVRCYSGGKIIGQVAGEKYNHRLRRLRQRDGMEFYFGDNCVVYRFPR